MRGGTFSAIAFAVLLLLCIRVVNSCTALLRSVIALHIMKQNHHVDFFFIGEQNRFLQCTTFIRLMYIDRPILAYHLVQLRFVFFNEYDISILS
jgi:hypothetical protein